MRRLLTTTYDIQASVLGHTAAPRELVEQAERAMLEVAHDDRRQDFRSIEEVLDAELDKLHRLSKEQTALTGTPSGFKDLDELTGGFQPGNLVVIAARPSMGKSCLITNIAENAAIEHQRPVALFSLEMSEAELAMRFVASQARVKGDDLSKGRAEKRWPKILDASQRLARAPIYVDDSSDVGILEVRAKARRLHAQTKGGLGLIIVDYLQLMRTDHRTDNRAEQVGHLSRGLKILARELEVPVVALSQLNRGVEARTDKRPLLSDLRESGCLTADSRIYLPDTGTYEPIGDLAGRVGFNVLALNPETWKLEARPVLKAFATGRKAVCRLTTRLGRTVRATPNHRFLTIEGWRRLDEIAVGTPIALPRELPNPSDSTMSTIELALLGHLIGDGCTLPRHAIQYTTNDPSLAELVSRLATKLFGDAVRPRINAERAWYQVYLAASGRLSRRVRNPVAQWLSELGVFGLRAHEKHVPDRVFEQSRDGVARFLRHLWSTDGCIWTSSNDALHSPAIYYATSSERLARDVQSLLLKLGINARRRVVSQKSKGKPQHHVSVSGAPDAKRFLALVGGLGDSREQSANAVLGWLAGRDTNTNRDIVPRSVWRDLAVPAMQASRLTNREMQVQLGTQYCGSTLYKSNLSRERAATVAEIVGAEELRLLAVSDVYWDQVASIDAAGEEEVYDLTVDGLHNFVAEDMVVHNSIEQDSDLVVFIYRDEYYNDDSEHEGEAELLISKHRNGPLGKVVLTFQAEYPKFMNFAGERFAS
jgi:replicative DNA helicase